MTPLGVTPWGCRDEAGSVAAGLLLPAVLAAVVGLVVVTAVGGVLLAGGRAQDAADEAAIAVVRAAVAGSPDPCGAAGRVAAGSPGEVSVRACRIVAGTATVRVAVAITTPLVRDLGVRHREAVASARVVPW